MITVSFLHVLTKTDFLSQKKNLSIQTDMSLPTSSNVCKTQINGEEISEGKTRILKDKVFIHDKDNFPFRRGKDIPVADPTYILTIIGYSIFAETFLFFINYTLLLFKK